MTSAIDVDFVAASAHGVYDPRHYTDVGDDVRRLLISFIDRDVTGD